MIRPGFKQPQILAFSLWPLAFSLHAATLTIQTNRLGPTPSLVAYNSGHFVPGSNTRDWWHYSGVNGARVFISPGIVEPSDDIPGRGDGVTDQASFLSRKAALSANPLDTNYINWPYLAGGFNAVTQHGSNLLQVNGACADLRS